jgi:hypothetical protein
VDRIHIAAADDNPLDLLNLKNILDDFRLDYKFTIAEDGEEARDFILKDGRYRIFLLLTSSCSI